MARRKRKDWSPSDWDFPTRLKHQKGGTGGWVYLSRDHLVMALGKGKGPPDAAELVATRTVFDPGTGQILIRLRKG